MQTITGEAGHFLRLLRKVADSPSNGGLSVQLFDIWDKNPKSRPLIALYLDTNRADKDLPKMVSWLNSELESNGCFSAELRSYGSELSGHLHRCRETRWTGRVDYFLEEANSAIGLAQTASDKWQVLKVAGLGLHKMGQFSRANACALIAYNIAQCMENEMLLQRSRFALLHASGAGGLADLRCEYKREFHAFNSGSLRYAVATQALIPSIAALHAMNLESDPFRDL